MSETLEGSLARARAAIEARRFQEARDCALEVFNQDANCLEAQFIVAVAAEGLGNFNDACELYAAVARRLPNTETVVRLAACLLRAERPQEALAALDNADETIRASANALLVRANALHGLRRFADARDVARAGLVRAPDSPLLAARLGASLMELDAFDEARVQFKRAANLSMQLSHCALVRVDRPQWDALENGTDADLPVAHVVHDAAPTSTQRYVVLASCDMEYLRRYGAAFVRSFVDNAARGARLHLHVIDPDDEFASFIEALSQETRLAGFRVTIDYSPDELAEHLNARRTYYTCARFVCLARLLTDYCLPVVALDIDAVIEHELNDLAALAADSDIVLLRREPPDSPWLDVIANHLVLAPTPVAIRFARRLATFIAQRATVAGLKWHLDQIALYCLVKMTERYAPNDRIGWIPHQLLTRVWHIGNPYRYQLDDARYQRYASPPARRGGNR